MPANTATVVPAFTQAANGTHAFLVPGPIPVARGNKDLTVTLGTIWSYITPCRLADMVTAVPNILAYTIEFFLTDLNGKTYLYYNNDSPYLAVIHTEDADVQVYVPTTVQVANGLVPGNYFHMLRITDPVGNVLVQTKGRVAVNALTTALPVPVDTDPYALSPNVTPVSEAAPTGSGAVETGTYQFSSSAQWIVNHNLGSYPAIVTVDTTGTRIWGEEAYIDDNNVSITFANPETGVCYLN